MARFPQRPASHIAADEAIRLFLSACPKEWVPSVVGPDYGLDLRIEVSRGGEVTGEEFYVQVKGRRSVTPKAPVVRIPQPTVNYWLGKIHPVLVVLVDLSRKRFWFDWLENAYREYPHQRDNSDLVALRLSMNSASSSLDEFAYGYLENYFSTLRRDIAAISEAGHIAKILLHTSALARACARMTLSLGTDREWQKEEVQNLFDGFFFEFGLHDQFLWSLWDEDSQWRRPLSGKAHTVLVSLLGKYVAARAKFWMSEHRQEAGDFQIVPIRYSDLPENLVPALDALWDLEEALTQLIALGRFVLPSTEGEPSGG